MSQPVEPLTVVVPTRDRAELLRRCLDALRASVGPTDEILVVDSASRDGRVRDVATQSGARYVRCDRPGGSLARNVGWRAASHDVVAFVDDDILVAPEWASAVRQVFARQPNLGMLTGSVEVPPEQAEVPHPAAVVNYPTAHALDQGPPQRRGISGNLVVRREALERVGGFDDMLGPGRLFRAAEDKDLFDRILLAGFSGRYEPSVRVAHVQWRKRGERVRLDWSYGFGAGAHAAKLFRLDRSHARRVLSQLLVEWGVKDLRANIRSGYKTGAVAAMLRTIAIVAGCVRGLTVPVRDGHYVARAWRRPRAADGSGVAGRRR